LRRADDLAARLGHDVSQLDLERLRVDRAFGEKSQPKHRYLLLAQKAPALGTRDSVGRSLDIVQGVRRGAE
jgi:hypothetical protein